MELPNISHTLPFGFRLRLDFLEACFSGPAYEVWGRWRENVDVANYLAIWAFGGAADAGLSRDHRPTFQVSMNNLIS
jgi:hypothetical protein